MEELEVGEVEYKSVENFFTILRKEFGGGEEESVKVAELRKLEQGGKTMKEFVQEFKRAARGSGGVQERNEWWNLEEVDGGRKPTSLHRTMV